MLTTDSRNKLVYFVSWFNAVIMLIDVRLYFREREKIISTKTYILITDTQNKKK